MPMTNPMPVTYCVADEDDHFSWEEASDSDEWDSASVEDVPSCGSQTPEDLIGSLSNSDGTNDDGDRLVPSLGAGS